MAKHRWWLIFELSLLAACGGRSGLETFSLDAGGRAGSAPVAGGSESLAGTIDRGGSDGGAPALGGRSGASSGGASGLSNGGASGGTSAGGAAGGGGTAGGSSGSSGMGGSAAGANGGSAGSAATGDWYVDPVQGSDDNPGRFDAPWKTLGRAAEVARGSESVWLFDGIYDATTEPRFADLAGLDCANGAGVAFAANVRVKALHSGQPHLRVQGQHGLCLSGGLVEGLSFECAEAGGRIVEVLTGVQTIDESSFTNCGSTSAASTAPDAAGIEASGDALVTLTPGNLLDFSGEPNYALASLRDSASLRVIGGTATVRFRGFIASGSGTLDLEGVTLIGKNAGERAQWAVSVIDGSPQVTLRGGSSVSGYSEGIYVGKGNPVLRVDNASFADSGIGIFARGMRGGVTNSHFANLNIGLFVFPSSQSADLSLSHLDFTAVDRPLYAMAGGRLSLSDIAISDCAAGALIAAYSSASPLDASLRRVSVTGCREGGVSLAGHASTHFDLGTSASPGENVLSGNQSSNLFFQSSDPTLISAIGNTWDPNQQGTDAMGQCPVPGSARTFDLTVASGANFTSGVGSQAVLRLAEQQP